MIHIRLTKIQFAPHARGFKDINAVYLNPYTVSEYTLDTYSGQDQKEVPVTKIYLTNGRVIHVEESEDEVLGLIHLATRRKLPRSIACVDVKVMQKLFAEAGSLENEEPYP